MKKLIFSQPERAGLGFALISVLALVSLAAMTATAFLASARLERQASRPLSQTIQLEWALASGEKCADQLIGDATEPAEGTAKNFVTTLWRGGKTTDHTNEIGYLLIGEPNANNNVRWTYWAGFSTAGLTNFSTTVIGSAIEFTNSHQGTFSNDCSIFMRAATNGFIGAPPPTNKVCTTIELLGGQTSPPVGWVYLTQRKRPAGSSTDVETPVARVAWFTEDLSGKIDAERMGLLSANRQTGTNPEEISLTSLIRTNGIAVLANTSLITSTNNRKLFFTPGLLANSNISGLTNTEDLRYFASGLREFRPTNNLGGTNGYLAWIPSGIPVRIAGINSNSYGSCGFTKANLNNFLSLPASSGSTNIANFILNNLPNFTNRAGGMNGTNYVNALAANIIDYADANSTPSTNTVGGNTVIGYDSYPLLTHLYDEFTYSSAARTITHRTWMQFWNPSTKSIAGNVTVTFTNNDTVRYTNSATPPVVVTRPLVTNAVGSVKGVTTTTFTLPTIQPNCGYVTSFTRPAINLGNAVEFPLFRPVGDPLIANLYINTTTANPSTTALPCNNSFSYLWGGATITPAMTIKRQNSTLANGVPTYCAGFLAGNQYIAGTAVAGTPLPIHDPRMTPYLGRGSANQYAQSSYATTYWRGYVSQSGLSANMGLADPASWPDAASTSVASHGTLGGTAPPTSGVFQNPESAPFKISNSGSYTNIFELGNIFDPIQWAPPSPTTTVNYSNSDINTNAGTIWTKNNLYGGGSTLRIGRPEHSLFAFTNFGGSGNPIPNMGQSGAALLDIFCVTNGNANGGPFRTGGKININTAPYPVLAALAGGITIAKDPNQVGTAANPSMIRAFATGVMKFRHLYPFLTPSQLLFISTNYGDANWTNSTAWSNAAVFSLNQGLTGITRLNDEGREEWFSKIYELSTVSSENYRVYIVAQLVDTNRMPTSPTVRKYVHFACRPDTTANGLTTNTSFGVNIYSWTLTKGVKKTYESPY